MTEHNDPTLTSSGTLRKPVSDAYTQLTDPSHPIDLWGPRTAAITEGYVKEAPRKRKPWGLPDVGWAAFYVFVVVQVLLLPILVVLAVSQSGLQLDTEAGMQALPEAMTKAATTGPGLVIAMIFQWAAFVGVPVWATYRKGHKSLAKDFGLWFKARDPLLGLALAASMQVVMAGFSYLLHLTSWDLSGADNTGQVTDQTGFYLIFMIVGATIGAPLTEELLFRGLILRAFLRKFARLDLAPVLPGLTDHFHPADVSERRRRRGIWLSVVLSALFFGLMHAQTLSLGAAVVVFQTGMLGLVFAVVAVRTRRLGVTVSAHFFFNSASIALALLSMH